MAKKSKAPAFQFYPSEFISDENVQVMNMEERGIYITLLCHCWIEGTIPGDVKRLGRMLGVQEDVMENAWEIIKTCFKRGRNGRCIHPRLSEERRKQSEFREKQRLNGMKGGRPTKPKGNPSLSQTQTDGEPKKSSPSPSPSSPPTVGRTVTVSPHSGDETGRPLSGKVSEQQKELGRKLKGREGEIHNPEGRVRLAMWLAQIIGRSERWVHAAIVESLEKHRPIGWLTKVLAEGEYPLETESTERASAEWKAYSL